MLVLISASLEMIQNTIERMSTLSSVFKGFAATVIIGIAAISFTEISICILVLTMLPVLCFAGMDIYYLSLEKKYRFLYENVRLGKKKTDFSMKINFEKGQAVLGRYRLIDCLKSGSIWGFYTFLIVIALITISLKMKGRI